MFILRIRGQQASRQSRNLWGGVMYKAVVFDFGNVLCRYTRKAIVDSLLEYSNLPRASVNAALSLPEVERDSETGRIDSREHFRRLKTIIAGDEGLTYEAFVRAYCAALSPNPDGEAALECAREIGLRTFVISNICFAHSTWLFSREPIAAIPELHLLSFRVGYMKPDPRIWLALLGYVRLEPSDCLYVDDLKENCDAASSLGFGIFRYNIEDQNLTARIAGLGTKKSR
jgi:FMN phosphatase YigB (HAD superfamily)